MKNNTTFKHPTHFSNGVGLIDQAHEKYKSLPTENWSYPIGYNWGNEKDSYYGEIWTDGIDWNCTYWLIETANLAKPGVYPLIHFSDNDDRRKYNDYDFEKLCLAIMYYRREILWIKSNDPKGVYSDIVWPFIRTVKPEERLKNPDCMLKHRVLHASQQKVEFFMNKTLIPEQIPVSNVIDVGGIKIESEYPIGNG